MTADKLCNDPRRAVPEMLEGAVALNPDAVMLDAIDEGVRVVCNGRHDPSKVAVISGGGSGHEPAMAGYVGPGMLAAAVAGDVFASPSTRAVYEAILKVTGAPGCLVVVLNYTGDRLNFGMAIERATSEGLKVELTAVADDCGVPTPGLAGARGIAGTILVLKAACAAAAAGASLAEVHRAAATTAATVSTMGAALSTCTLPGTAADADAVLAPGTMELGLGIHGERGAEKCAVQTSEATVRLLLDKVCSAARRHPEVATEAEHVDRETLEALKEGDDVAVVINNLGSTTNMELMIVVRDTLKLLEEKRLNVKRMLVGTYVSSLEMAGVSISVMHVTDALCALLDAPTEVPAWPRRMYSPQTKPLVPCSDQSSMAAESKRDAARTASTPVTSESHVLIRVLQHCAAACIEAEPELTHQDKLCGDGDCGQTIKQGAEGILSVLPGLQLDDLGVAASQLASAVGKAMGGTSGALYNLFFTAASGSLKGTHADKATPDLWAQALASGVRAIKRYGRARIGDRSMVDAIEPASTAASKAAAQEGMLEVAKEASNAASSGAEATKSMSGCAGRSGYVNRSTLQGIPDPGAHAVAVWMRAITEQLETEKSM